MLAKDGRPFTLEALDQRAVIGGELVGRQVRLQRKQEKALAWFRASW